MMPSRALLLLLVLTAGFGCSKPRRPGDDQILLAGSEAEREALKERREQIELEFERQLREKDQEIERLRAENQSLREQL